MEYPALLVPSSMIHSVPFVVNIMVVLESAGVSWFTNLSITLVNEFLK